MNSRAYIFIAACVVILALAVGIGAIEKGYRQAIPELVESPVATTTPQSVENRNIVRAMGDFAQKAPALFEDNYVCKGGFINEEIEELKRISDVIVANRLFDPETAQYAVNQDEAGISCLEKEDNWVLFTALNQDGKIAQDDFYCVDSQGAKGKLAIDRENVSCLEAEM